MHHPWRSVVRLALVPAGLLLLAIATPSAGLLWFMLRAVENERLAVREELTRLVTEEAERRAHLTSLHVLKYVLTLENAATAMGDEPAPRDFKALALSVPCGGMVLLDNRDGIAYPADPDVTIGPLPDGPIWQEAQRLEFVAQDYTAAIEQYQEYGFSVEPEERLQDVAFLAMGRCAARQSRMDLALTWLTGVHPLDPLNSGIGLRDNRGEIRDPEALGSLLTNPYPDLAGYYDAQGNLLRANALDHGLTIAHTMDPAKFGIDPAIRDGLEQTLCTWLLDYDGTPMRPTQRQLLMQSSLARGKGPNAETLQRLRAAEQAARDFLDLLASGLALPESGKLTPVGKKRLWVLPTKPDDRVLWILLDDDVQRLFSESEISPATTPTSLGGALGERLLFTTDYFDPEVGTAQIPALARVPMDPLLPNWYVIATGDLPGLSEERFSARSATYAWTGVLVLSIVLAAATLLSLYYFRQLRVTRLKNDLIATVSHELRTPLASMRVLVDTLLEERLHDPAAQKEYLALIARENLRLSHMVENFLTFSRMERNSFPLQSETVAVERLVDEAVASVAERFAKAGRPIEVQLAENLPHLNCDPEAMVSALVNLLDNAHKFSPDGTTPITIGATAEIDHVCLSVADQGIGLSRRAASRVFRRYYQADQRLARTVGGSGLGLSIVDHIMKAHGGRVTVESTPGEGSTFALHIPVTLED